MDHTRRSQIKKWRGARKRPPTIAGIIQVIFLLAPLNREQEGHFCNKGYEMKFLRLLITPLFVAALLSAAAGLYSVPAVTAHQQRSAHSKKPVQFHYVCPMHEDVTSRKRGTCHKCKMKLVRKAVKEKPSTGSN